MFKIIFTIIFTYFFAKFMHIIYSDEYSGFAKKVIVSYTVKAKEGAIACATEEIYKNIQNFYLKNDLKSIQSQINNKNCMLLKSGEKLEAHEGICDIADKNSVKLFKSKKVFLQKIYVPCFAVEMEKIVENPESDLENKGSEENQQTDVENKKSSENQPPEQNKIQQISEEKISKEQSQENIENKNIEPQNNNR